MRYFNTTLVTVYLPKFIHLVFQKKFQYNSCYCLSYTPDGTVLYENHFNTTLVTVYHHGRSCRNAITVISIQLLLLFIFISSLLVWISFVISIQLLLLFKGLQDTIRQVNFNTTLVTVYQPYFSLLLYFKSISIQLLLLFIIMIILCQQPHINFNTTLVTVYPTLLSHSSFSLQSVSLIKSTFLYIFPNHRQFSHIFLQCGLKWLFPVVYSHLSILSVGKSAKYCDKFSGLLFQRRKSPKQPTWTQFLQISIHQSSQAIQRQYFITIGGTHFKA